MSQEISNELREGSRTNTSTFGQAGKEVVKVIKVDRRGVGVDDIASSIAGILHHGPKQEGSLKGALVNECNEFAGIPEVVVTAWPLKGPHFAQLQPSQSSWGALGGSWRAKIYQTITGCSQIDLLGMLLGNLGLTKCTKH